MSDLDLNNQRKVDKSAKTICSLISSGRLNNGIAQELQNPLDRIIDSTNSTNALLLKLTRDSLIDNEDTLDVVGSIEDNLARIDEHVMQAYKLLAHMQQNVTGKISNQKTTDIHELLLESTNLVHKSKNNPDFKIRIEKKFTPELQPILINVTELAQVFSHIIDNALDSMLEKVETVKNFKPTLTLETKINSNQLMISIIDNGVGIPVEMHDKIFEPFYTTKQAEHCLGLGLTASKDTIINLINGDIEVDSGPEWGTSIDITFDLTRGCNGKS
jgi:signal transduction histidine kinase